MVQKGSCFLLSQELEQSRGDIVVSGEEATSFFHLLEWIQNLVGRASVHHARLHIALTGSRARIIKG